MPRTTVVYSVASQTRGRWPESLAVAPSKPSTVETSSEASETGHGQQRPLQNGNVVMAHAQYS